MAPVSDMGKYRQTITCRSLNESRRQCSVLVEMEHLMPEEVAVGS